MVLNSFDFIDRVASENQWSYDYTMAVIKEYHRFIYLARFTKVAPSYEIDQVWHSHILFSEHYARFCKRVAGKFIHHNPTPSEEKINPNRIDPYEGTKEAYWMVFGKEPPKHIWTPWKYMENVFVDKTKYFIIKKPNFKRFIFSLFKTKSK